MIQIYKNLGRNSGVAGYKIDSDSITVWFNDGSSYLYTNLRPGIAAVSEMKRLAVMGQGLNSYISRYIKKNYAKKLA